MTVTTRIGKEQLEILRLFAAGETSDDVRRATGSSDIFVTATLAKLCDFNRDTAGKLVAAHGPVNGTPQPAAAKPAAAKPPSPKPAAVAAPWTYERLLEGAEDSDDAQLTRLAAKARALLDDLQDRYDAFEADREARAEIAKLERQLAAARSRLKTKPPGARTVPSPSRKDRNARIRAWAAKKDYSVGPTGRIPRWIVEAYEADTGDVDG